MPKPLVALLLVFAAWQCVSPAAENTGTDIPAEVEIAPAGSKPKMAEQKTPPNDAALRESTNLFAWNLFLELSKTNKTANPLLGIQSIEEVLNQLALGARGQTARAMRSALQLPLGASIDSLAAKQRRAFLKGSKATDGFTSASVGRLWLQKGEAIEPSFQKILHENFSTSALEADFRNSVPRIKVINQINKWVEEETEGYIKKLVDTRSITKETRLVLANAALFLGDWRFPFRSAQTRKQTFFNANGTKIAKAMLGLKKGLPYASNGAVQYLALPYRKTKAEGPDYVMEIFLPVQTKKLPWLAAKLKAGLAAKLRKDATTKLVNLRLPKWEVKSPSLSLRASLIGLGMQPAFAPYLAKKSQTTADFSGINGKRDLYLGDVLHKAFVRVDEKGTAAAAATAGVVFGVTSAAPMAKSIDFVADHPFIYTIREQQTDSLLFLGRLTEL